MFGLLNTRFVRLYVVPGAVFQSVMIGGGYGTGREIVEYFTGYGPLGGLLGLVVAFATLAVVLALTFEFARVYGAYEYGKFFKRLVGKGWIGFEVLIILQFLLVLAVLASAAGNILRDHLGLPYGVGLSVMLAVIGVLTFYGREVIAKALTFWSFVLYAAFVAFFIAVFSRTTTSLSGIFENTQIIGGWWQSGFKYALYNLAVAPLLLYVARGFERRAQAFLSGAIGAAIAIVPAVIFQLTFSTVYPQVLQQAIPVYWMIGEMGLSVLLIVYSLMLFGTFIETGAGMLQGINERIDAHLTETRGRGLGRMAHAVLAVAAILISALLSLWGITKLIAQGYGAMAWGFLIIYVLPLLTVGLYRIVKTTR
jgi:uncharacterized membrane protein YkvI